MHENYIESVQYWICKTINILHIQEESVDFGLGEYLAACFIIGVTDYVCLFYCIGDCISIP